tara:strand:+ start:568 stop:1059 length:492 start_codon:yes stop_codon:yes gene_type:complete
MLEEDSLENEHISCKVLRQNINISIECVIKDEMLDNKVYYYAANTPDRLTNFSGSGLPFPSKEVAFEGSPNIGRKIIENEEKQFRLELLRPNSYYDENYELVEPEVIIKYFLKNNKTRVLNIPIDNKIPYRFLLQNKNKPEKSLVIETQEKMLLKNQYPNILI